MYLKMLCMSAPIRHPERRSCLRAERRLFAKGSGEGLARIRCASRSHDPDHRHPIRLAFLLPTELILPGRPITQPQPEVQSKPVPQVHLRPKPRGDHLSRRPLLQQPHRLRTVAPSAMSLSQRDERGHQPAVYHHVLEEADRLLLVCSLNSHQTSTFSVRLMSQLLV